MRWMPPSAAWLSGSAPKAACQAVTATVGVICLAGGLHQPFFLGAARWWERLLLLVAALVLIKPGWASDLVGVGLFVVVLASQRWVRRRGSAGRSMPELP